jgi:hypothetical protein
MITMVDEIYDRGYQAGRTQLHDGIDRLLGRLRAALTPAMTTLHHLEWDAPWQAAARPKH